MFRYINFCHYVTEFSSKPSYNEIYKMKFFALMFLLLGTVLLLPVNGTSSNNLEKNVLNSRKGGRTPNHPGTGGPNGQRR